MVVLVLTLVIIVLIILLVHNNYRKVKIETVNNEIAQKNKELYSHFEKLNQEKNGVIQDINKLKNEENEILTHIDSLSQSATKIYEDKVAAAEQAFSNYKDNLQNKYDSVKDEYENLELLLKNAYDNKQMNLIKEKEDIEKDIQKIKSSREAFIKSQLREKEIREKQDFYCLQVSDEDKSDIAKLENLKKSFNKPRVISMLIWQTYFQKNLKAKAANILGSKTVTGIYKITNIDTGECYIGQAVDVATRWSEHAKCGLGIDTPAANKLYKAMQEYGLTSFSWELLEECPQPQLNEKEKYYISLYDSCNFGYNTSKGVGK